MKNILLFLSLLVLMGCTGKDSERTATSRAEEAGKLQGIWLSDDYLRAVEKSKSVYQSRNYTSRFWGFRLDKANLLSDSAVISGFTEHEGGLTCDLLFDESKGRFTHNLAAGESYRYLHGIPFALRASNAGLAELQLENQKEMYRKVSGDQDAFRGILFAGKYADLNNPGNVIEFTTDGKVSGIANTGYYDVVYDFGEGIEYDACIFYKDKATSGIWVNGDMYHYKINADTLKLYKIHTDWNEMNHRIGEVTYLLKKVSDRQ